MPYRKLLSDKLNNTEKAMSPSDWIDAWLERSGKALTTDPQLISDLIDDYFIYYRAYGLSNGCRMKPSKVVAALLRKITEVTYE